MGRTRITPWLAVIAAMTLLPGCWLQIGFGANHRRHNTLEAGLTRANVASLAVAWTTTMEGTMFEPMVSGGRVFVSSGSVTPGIMRVRAVHAQTGETLWERSLFDGRDGVQLVPVATAIAESEVWASYLVAATVGPGGCLAEQERIGLVDGASTSTPDLYGRPPVTSGSLMARVEQTVTSVVGGCLIGTPELVVQDLDTDTVLWRSPVPSELSFADASRLATIAGDQVSIVVGSVLRVFSVAGCGAPTCSPVWTLDLSQGATVGGPPVGGTGSQLFLTSATELLALDTDAQAVAWRAPHTGTDAQLALADGIAYLAALGSGAGANALQAFNADGCDTAICGPLWTAATTAPVTSAPVVAGEVVYVGTEAGVDAFDADGCGATSCPPLVSLTTPHPVAHLSVGDGRLFAAGASTVTTFAPNG
ncbi:MAG: PQQ-binding-like beta-propeller repeat protein [Acidimicrobiales bacterium]